MKDARRSKPSEPSPSRVDHEPITTDRELAKLCRELATAPLVAFDTEFVSEHTYRPQLCLIQVAGGERAAVIDPQAVDVTPFWQLVASGEHETVVHSGREELLFCLSAVGKPPARLFDVQIAAGLVGYEFPAAYGSLMYKLLGTRLSKGETRTDWRRRPLSHNQISYALDDVRYLGPMALKLRKRLEQLDRASWLADEMAAWQAEVGATRGDQRWWKVSGTSGLSRRSLAIVRELWLWREREAERRDWPPRRVLRDDLIVELAKRKTSDPKQIRAVRGMERRDFERIVPHLSAAIERGLNAADDECPTPGKRDVSSQLNVLGQFLSTALASICRAAELAPAIVGTASDVRDLVAYRLGLAPDNGQGEPPLLARGWRAQIVGRQIDDLLAGRLAIRVADPLAAEPLAFEPLEGREDA